MKNAWRWRLLSLLLVVAMIAQSGTAFANSTESGGSNTYYINGKVSTGDAGTGSRENPFEDIKYALKNPNLKNGDTIVIVENGYANDESVGGQGQNAPLIIDKKITIKGEVVNEKRPSFNVRRADIILGADVVLQDFDFNYTNSSCRIFANGHKLELNNIGYIKGTQLVNIYGGAKGGTSVQQGDKSEVTIKGENTYIGNIYAGGNLYEKDNDSNTWNKPTEITVDGVVASIGKIFASGEANDVNISDVTEKVTINLINTNVKQVDGKQNSDGHKATVIVSEKGNNFSMILENIGKLIVETGRLIPKFLNPGAEIEIRSKGILDLQEVVKNTGEFSVSTLNGDKGSLLYVDEQTTLKITDSFTGEIELRTPSAELNQKTSGPVKLNHPYIDVKEIKTATGTLEFKPYWTQENEIELKLIDDQWCTVKREDTNPPKVDSDDSSSSKNGPTVEADTIYANGFPIIIEGKEGTKETKIKYYDGQKWLYIDLNPDKEGVQDTADLKDYAIFGGAAKDEVENTNITMTGGLVSYIYGGGDSGAVKGDTSVTVTGGEVGTVHGGAYDGDVKGNAYINIGKEAKTDAIYGWGDSDKPVGGKSYGYVEEAEGLSWGRTESFDNLLWKQEDGNWSVQGNPFIPEGFTTTISETKKLVVPAGFTLTCKGTMLNRGTVENNGTIKNDGKIQNFGKISGNGEIKGTPVEDSNPSTSDEGNTSGGDSASGGGNTSGGGNVSGGGGDTSGGGNISGGGGNTSGGGNVSGGGGNTSGGSTSKDDTSGTTPPVATEKPESVTKPAATTVKATYQGSKATATLSKSTVNKAIKEAKAEAEKSGKEADEIAVTIQADTDKAKNFAFNLPKATVSELVENEVKEISIRNDVSTITLDRDTLKEIQKQVNKDVTATINKVNNSTLSASAKKKVGKRPVYDFSITAKNGKKVTDFGNGKVKISIPYKLGVNEKASNLVVYYINDKGKTQEMPNSVYNEEAKAISFVTDHFSKFAVGYKTGTTTFKDITTHWAKESIEFVTARGILEGTGKTEFSPDKAVTKELMAATLGRIANADVSKYKKSSFSDVKTKSSYFGYIVWADKKGIIKGDTKTTFVPNKTITHEQMAVIMVNYAKAMGFDLSKLREEKAFADQDKISNSAKSAVKKLQMAGILNEREGSSFEPQGILTRAELSTVLKHFVEAISGTGTGQ